MGRDERYKRLEEYGRWKNEREGRGKESRGGGLKNMGYERV
jgi:hypothetical protein